MEISRDTRLKDVIKTASGHDIIARLLYSLGLDLDTVRKTPLGLLKVSALKRLSLGKLSDDSVDALVEILNSLSDDEPSEDGEIRQEWWKEAVFYQVYPRSFRDSNGDGVGDIPGIIEKLGYIKSLGVDAIWCSPFFDSPNADNGYDIRDYRKIMAEFGTLDDVKRLIEECHKRGMRLIIDLVMNHTSDEHEWFRKALSGDGKYADYYIWKDEPNNWTSFFSGPAWRYFPETGRYALHLFADKQMDLNWDNPEVRREMYDIADFWLGLGADGFRLDVVSFISKAEGLPDGDPTVGKLISFTGIEHYFHGPHLDEYLREFNREVLEPHKAYTVGECPGNGIKMSRMITGDDRGELSQLFSFDHIDNPGKKRYDVYELDLRKMMPELLRWQTEYSDHCWPTLFFDNHDNPRMCSKIDHEGRYHDEINKLLATILLTMKGTPYIYQGSEIGMTNYPFSDISQYRDIESLNFYKEHTGSGMPEKEALKRLLYGSRDHARVPMQWDGNLNAGFSDAEPWIAVNPDHEKINAADEYFDPDSVLNYYRYMIGLRKDHRKTLIYGSFRKIGSGKDVLAFVREANERFTVVVNLTGRTVRRPDGILGDRIISNYKDTSEKLRPYEAEVYFSRV